MYCALIDRDWDEYEVELGLRAGRGRGRFGGRSPFGLKC